MSVYLLKQQFRIPLKNIYNFCVLRTFVLSSNMKLKPVNVGNFTSNQTNVFGHLNIVRSPITLNLKRNFSKKKKGPKHQAGSDESDSDDEIEENEETEGITDEDNIFTKRLPSLRMDNVIKSALNTNKRKIERDFYASKIRINGERVTKKAHLIVVNDEIDVIKDISPDNPKFLVVDRIVIKSIGNVTGSATYPITMQVLKSLIVENYSDPWKPSDTLEID